MSGTGRTFGSTGAQDQGREQGREQEPAAPAPSTAEGGRSVRPLLDDVDGLLDEIDAVLESNAEEFVRGYVQKGGQ
jgi:ubiquitin-like protein Pup